MRVFKISDDSLQAARERHWGLERDIQQLCERNLEVPFGLEFVDSEVEVRGFRIDTLAFDPENGAFVLIEYKRGSSVSVIDQGFAYLNVLLNNEAEFVLRYNESRNGSLAKRDVDWKKARVYFVAPNFTSYQRQAVGFKDLPFDLWELTLFGEELLILNHVGDEGGAAVIAGLGLDQAAKGVVRIPTPQQHFQGRPRKIRELYERLRAGIVALADDVAERAITVAILFEYQGNRFAEIVPQQKQLVIHFDYYDGNSRGLSVRDLEAEGKGHYWAVGPYQVKIKPGEDPSPVLELLRASFDLLTTTL